MSKVIDSKQIPVCPRCGSDDVAADAAARWDVQNQDWSVSDIFDKGHSCGNCGAENITFAWIGENAQALRS
jgi:RNA polymerase subunit RPABC4/transcription elongation factor Spt4